MPAFSVWAHGHPIIHGQSILLIDCPCVLFSVLSKLANMSANTT